MNINTDKTDKVVDVKGSRNRVTDGEILIRKGVLTQSEACSYFSITKTTLIAWGKAGVLKPIKIVGRTYYEVQDIEQLLTNNKGGE